MARQALAKTLALEEQAVETTRAGPLSPRTSRVKSVMENMLCVVR